MEAQFFSPYFIPSSQPGLMGKDEPAVKFRTNIAREKPTDS